MVEGQEEGKGEGGRVGGEAEGMVEGKRERVAKQELEKEKWWKGKVKGQKKKDERGKWEMRRQVKGTEERRKRTRKGKRAKGEGEREGEAERCMGEAGREKSTRNLNFAACVFPFIEISPASAFRSLFCSPADIYIYIFSRFLIPAEWPSQECSFVRFFPRHIFVYYAFLVRPLSPIRFVASGVS